MAKVVHFEIPFDNKGRAMKFYKDALDWQLTDMPEMSYVMAQTSPVDQNQMPKEPGSINGGLFQRPKEAPHPAIYVGVESIDATIKKVKAAGRQGSHAQHTDPRHGRLRACIRYRRQRDRPVPKRLAQRNIRWASFRSRVRLRAMSRTFSNCDASCVHSSVAAPIHPDVDHPNRSLEPGF